MFLLHERPAGTHHVGVVAGTLLWASMASCAWELAVFLKQGVRRHAVAAADRGDAARLRNGFEDAAARVANLVKARRIW